jgi:hypothetical protein
MPAPLREATEPRSLPLYRVSYPLSSGRGSHIPGLVTDLHSILVRRIADTPLILMLQRIPRHMKQRGDGDETISLTSEACDNHRESINRFASILE